MTFDEPQDLNVAAAQQDVASAQPAPPPVMPPMLPPGAMGGPMPQPQRQGPNPLAALVLGLMAGAGPRSGMAAGVGQGFQQHQAQMQAVEQQRRKQLEAQNAQRNQMLMQALETMKKRRDQIPNKGQYDTELEGWATQLRSAGFRVDSNWLRQTVPYVAPDVSRQAADAVKAYLTNPANKQVMEQHPEQLANVYVKFDRDGDGLPESVPLLQLAEIGKVPFSIDQGGQVIGYPKDTTPEDAMSIDAEFNDVLAQAKAEGKNVQDPAIRRAIRSRVMQEWESRKRLTTGQGKGTPYQDARVQAVAEYTEKFGPLPRGFASEGGLRNVANGEQGGHRSVQAANNWIANRTAELMEKSKPATEKAANYQEKTGVVPGYEKMGPIKYLLDPSTGDVVVGGKRLGPVVIRDAAPADDPMTAMNKYTITKDLSKQLSDATKPLREMERQMKLMEVGLQRYRSGDKPGGAEAIRVTFEKILDPGSVVREGEYNRQGELQPFFDRIQAHVRSLGAGGGNISEAGLAAMVETARQMTQAMSGAYEGERKRIGTMADEYKIRRNLIFGESPAPSQPAAPSRTRPNNLTPGLQMLENR